MGRRHRQREQLTAAVTDYADSEGNLLVLRGSLSPPSRRRYAQTWQGGLHREDAQARALELLFEHLAVSWTISELPITRQAELLARFRIASLPEREFVRQSLRAHLAEHFPELQVP